MKTNTTLLLSLLACSIAFGQVKQSINGQLTNDDGLALPNTKISVIGTNVQTVSDHQGNFTLENLPAGDYTLRITTKKGVKTYPIHIQEGETIHHIQLTLDGDINQLEGVEIFGERNKKQRGIEAITRFPINTKDQIQSISVISEKLIEDQGALTITDAARNVPGVTLFGSYGGNRESMSIRGFRGTPVLKNGVRMDSDFRTAAAISDMQGVESIQVIRGSAAITQGVGNDLGAAGGVINVVTKTPRFTNDANIGLRVGSWNRIRTTFDVQRVVTENKNLAFRLTGAYQRGDSYRDMVKNDRFYINPSMTWKIDDKTEVILEMDYLNDKATPDRGTINLSSIQEENLVDMGHKFLGFKDDVAKIENITYAARINRKLTDKIDVRVAYFNSFYESDQTAATLSTVKGQGFNIRSRGLGRSFRDDRNSTIQADIMGKEFKAGILKWSWQVGYDYSTSRVDSRSATGIKDLESPINVYNEIANPNATDLDAYNLEAMQLGKSKLTKTNFYGFMTQHHIGITDYVKVIGGLRWSYSLNDHKDVLDPMVGLMLSPTKNINVFGSYTTTSSLRNAANPLIGGGTVGTSRTNQLEFGVKSEWFNDRLRANVTYFDMDNKNLSYEVLDATGNPLPSRVYDLAGNLKRNGVEVEVSGRPLPNLQVMLGYAYLDARYENSPAYMDESRPMNAPYNTANAWVQYKFQNTNSFVDGLSLSAGVYYVGDRPVNEYTKKTAIHNTTPGEKPFLMPDYTTVNAQVAYAFKRFDVRLFINNITDQIGYNSYYRGGYINQIDPFNMAGQIVYKF